MKEAKNDAKRPLRLPPKDAVRAGLMPAEGNDAYLNAATPPLIIAPPPSTLPRILTDDCALHHISEKFDGVVIRMDDSVSMTTDFAAWVIILRVSAAQFDLNWSHRQPPI